MVVDSMDCGKGGVTVVFFGGRDWGTARREGLCDEESSVRLAQNSGGASQGIC